MPLNEHSPHRPADTAQEASRISQRESLVDPEAEASLATLLDTEERSHAATRGHLTRAKKQVHRAEHGVCPHCNRSFQNLARHMQTKHEREVVPGT